MEFSSRANLRDFVLYLISSLAWFLFAQSAFLQTDKSWYLYLISGRLLAGFLAAVNSGLAIFGKRRLSYSDYCAFCMVIQASFTLLEAIELSGLRHDVAFFQYVTVFLMLNSLSYQGKSIKTWCYRYGMIVVPSLVIPLMFMQSSYFESVAAVVFNLTMPICLIFVSVIILFLNTQNTSARLEKDLLQERINRLTQKSLDDERKMRAQIECELKEALERLRREEKNSIIANAVANIAHDLRSPLGVFQNLIQQEALPPHAMKSARSAMARVYTMIEAFRNADADRIIKRSHGKIDLEGLINEVAAGNDVRINFKTEVSANCYLDHPKVERIILNLLKNAVEAGAKSIEIQQIAVKESLIFTVIDDGPGIPPDFVSKMFERGATLNKKFGTGLGLAYVLDVARGHGGDVTYGRQGAKTIFRVFFPDAIVTTNFGDEAPKSNLESQELVRPSLKHNARKLKVLLNIESSEKLQLELFDAMKRESEISVTLDPKEVKCVAVAVTDSIKIGLDVIVAGGAKIDVNHGDDVDFLMRRIKSQLSVVRRKWEMDGVEFD